MTLYMKFYDRTMELKELTALFNAAASRMVVLTGRRRVGKTILALEFGFKEYPQYKFTYLSLSLEDVEGLLATFRS